MQGGLMKLILSLIMFFIILFSNLVSAEESEVYKIGVDDILQISVIKPDEITNIVTVSPDGSITFPYIGALKVKGMRLSEVRQEVEPRLADGYMNYPFVSVVLQGSRSRKFFVCGEVIKPGPYPLEENTTILRAISMCGGFTKYGSSSHVKLLRPKTDQPGYETIRSEERRVG